VQSDFTVPGLERDVGDGASGAAGCGALHIAFGVEGVSGDSVKGNRASRGDDRSGFHISPRACNAGG
jgi:hypothetical protein